MQSECLFRIEDNAGTSTIHVLPDGVPNKALTANQKVAVRDRLNALLSNMIHQHKRIALTNLRTLQDGRLAASVTINGVELASDQQLHELGARVPSPDE